MAPNSPQPTPQNPTTTGSQPPARQEQASPTEPDSPARESRSVLQSRARAYALHEASTACQEIMANSSFDGLDDREIRRVERELERLGDELYRRAIRIQERLKRNGAG